VAVSGQTITVSGVTLSGGSTFTIVYGSKASAGPGAVAGGTTGAQTWQAQEKSTSTGTLTNLASSPVITVNAADGTATLTTPTTNLSLSSSGNTLTFTYTAATGGTNNGTVTLVVPSGWSAPSLTGSAAGFTTASLGTLAVAGQTITVSGLTISAGNTFTIVYGSKTSSGPGATAAATSGAQTWQGQEESTATGTLTNFASSPSITLNAANGSGTLTTPTTNVVLSATGNTLTFTYTAATGGINGGTVTLVVPSGWSAPSLTGSAAGDTTASTGTVAVAGQTITVSGVTLTAGSTFTIVYGSKVSSGPGATAGGTTGAQTWQAQEASTSTGTLTNLASSPSITLNAANGSGTLTTTTSAVSASDSSGNTLTFTYTAATGGINNGTVTLVVPSGWSAPSLTGAAAGFTTASTGTMAVAGQTITVTGVTLTSGSTFTIVYGSVASGGPGAVATAAPGAQTWQAQEASLSTGTLTNLASSPIITVYAADGTGTMTTPTTNVALSSSGNTLTFTYTAATGGISNGTVTLVVPSGWSAPSLTGSAAGFTTATSGTLAVAGQTITVSAVTLTAGSTFTVVYGSKTSSGPGATAAATNGAQTWQAQEKSTSTGALTNLASSPSITLNAANGSGTLTTPTTTVTHSSTGNTLTFTYTAATGGISNGTVTLVVPSGWSAPSLTGSAAGDTTASTGTVAVSGQTITVSAVTLTAGSTFTIVYGSKVSAGPGATATATTGAQTWQVQEASVAGGSLTNLATSPSINVQ
jgi:ribosomal protein S4